MKLHTRISHQLSADLQEFVGDRAGEDIFVLTDETTRDCCLPRLLAWDRLWTSHQITIPAGDEHKTLESAAFIWRYLSEHGATRSSLMINLGGGMITDIGGFTASTFKRGMAYVNLPTTLLGAVDAATGGKTGVNFLGLKNEIGVFAPARAVLIDVNFFRTLDDRNLRSGFAEMVKHALLDGEEAWRDVLAFDLDEVDFDRLAVLLEKNIDIKESIVAQDPTEKGLRKALNLGHTFGHAFESLSYKTGRPLLHGYAVMWGLLCELYLSHVRLGFPKEDIARLRGLIREYYGTFDFSCKQYDALLELMTHDKKNESKDINFTLLGKPGDVRINQTATKEEILECLDYVREG